MKSFLVGLLIIAFSCPCQAQNPVLEWAKSTQGNRYSLGKSIATDKSGNVCIAGQFRGTVDFDPGTGVFSLSANSVWDVFVQKLDDQGNFIWAKSFGGYQNDQAYGIATDALNNVFVTGRFSDTVDFDPGAGVHNLHSNGNASYDCFIVKLDSNGLFQWARTIGSTSIDEGSAVTTDNSGNVYVTGLFSGTVDFDPGTGTSLLTSNGVEDSYILKLDSAGNFIWAKSMGSTFGDIGRHIQIDGLGNVVSTGTYTGTVDFDPGSGTYNLSSIGSYHTYIQKLDSNGNFIWAKSVGSTITAGNCVAIDLNNDIYVSGIFHVIGDFDPGSAVYNLTPKGNADAFLIKLNSSGNFLWATSTGGNSFDASTSVSTDRSGNVFATGSFSKTVDFDPGVSTYNLTALGSYDAYIQQLDSNGNFLWAGSMGGTGSDVGYSMAIDGKRNVYLTGLYTKIADLDPGSGVFNLNSNALNEAFIQKINQCANGGVDTQVACDSIVWIDGITYKSNNNTAQFRLLNKQGCDSLVSLNLNINRSNQKVDTVNSCTAYTWINGVTYSANNDTARYILTNSTGCDSIIRLNLKINSSQRTERIKACDSLKWIDGITYTEDNDTSQITFINSLGCDSVVKLDLNLGRSSSSVDVATACNQYTWLDGNTYYASTEAPKYILTNSGGCDSTVHLDLDIKKVSSDEILVKDSILTSQATNANYQWLSCGVETNRILGANERTYTPVLNGNYQVVITQNGCIDTSECIPLNYYVVPVYGPFNCKSIYPNPSHDRVYLELGDLENVEISLYSLHGELIGQERVEAGPVHLLNLELPAGVYLLRVNSGNLNHSCRLEIN
tara:strand:+ start:10855 stop:13362 length:2508 start_codon:yes stop_codon:yes gene_type:complete